MLSKLKNKIFERLLDKPGKGTRPKAPCDGKENIESCSCEDGGFFIISQDL